MGLGKSQKSFGGILRLFYVLRATDKYGCWALILVISCVIRDGCQQGQKSEEGHTPPISPFSPGFSLRQ
jgi:hypothetical protein